MAPTIQVHWWNGTHGRLRPRARVFSAYLDEPTKLREASTMTPTKDQALQPVWGIIAHRQMIGQPFIHSAGKETRPSLPPHFHPDFHRQLAPLRPGETAHETQPKSVYCPSRHRHAHSILCECVMQVLPALLYLELDGNRATKAKGGAVAVPAPLELRSLILAPAHLGP
jgi:hypothetical protein